MADPFDTPPQSEPARQPATPPDQVSEHSRLLGQIREAERQAEQVAYSDHRDRVRMELGAPRVPSRGNGDCLALALLPLGLILLVVHPAPAIAVLVAVGWLYLVGSDRQRSDREAIQAADREAERLWRQRESDPNDP
jgi:hypothetical protein